MRHETLVFGIVACLAASLASAQDRGTATGTATRSVGSDTSAQSLAAKPQKPLSPIGRAMADLLRAAAQAPAVTPHTGADATPNTGAATPGTAAADKPPAPDQVAVH